MWDLSGKGRLEALQASKRTAGDLAAGHLLCKSQLRSSLPTMASLVTAS